MLKKGDRVKITIPVTNRQPWVYRGMIIGESKDKTAWRVRHHGDAASTVHNYNKGFCEHDPQIAPNDHDV